ncbi:MAG: phosphoenolpyruvate hydrolase family protein [Selenomonadaceae bacterium]|nr:phosphoenolpyruvate hydrolase family protein [Selenomonadaceae bacterium]
MERNEILSRLRMELKDKGHIIGAAVGSGLTAKFAALGGADLLLALSAGRYRIMGRSSLSNYLCYGNNNEQVMTLGCREIFPIVRDVPLIFGLMAGDPFINLYDYISEIKRNGFSGIVNFPTVALIDGNFREALEAEGNTFDREVAAIKMARHFDLFTAAFVTNVDEARRMLDAGADVICVHLGLTKGGFLGAKTYITLDEAGRLVEKIFRVCRALKPDVVRMIYAGAVNSPVDMNYLYRNADCQGYIGGSTFDRIPMERSILDAVKTFKGGDDHTTVDILGAIEFIKQFVEDHYAEPLELRELAATVKFSPSYLSTSFKREVGLTFSDYLLRRRLDKATELLRQKKYRCHEVASMVGYDNYPQFSKTFKQFIGRTPKEFQYDI